MGTCEEGVSEVFGIGGEDSVVLVTLLSVVWLGGSVGSSGGETLSPSSGRWGAACVSERMAVKAVPHVMQNLSSSNAGFPQ